MDSTPPSAWSSTAWTWVVDEIASQPRNMLTNKPKKPQVMKSVTVDTQGVEYPEPEKLPDPFHS